MNQYLFLYPHKRYFEYYFGIAGFDIEKLHLLFRIIDARYRENGYDINWLLFSSAEDISRPERGTVPDFVNIKSNDRILVAGNRNKFDKEFAYADSDFVLDQLPERNRLVLGGFHQFDCVEKIARRSYEKGVDTFVDEDTTEGFFFRVMSHQIPLVREEWSLDALGFSEKAKWYAQDIRRDKPWLVQP